MKTTKMLDLQIHRNYTFKGLALARTQKTSPIYGKCKKVVENVGPRKICSKFFSIMAYLSENLRAADLEFSVFCPQAQFGIVKMSTK